MNLKDLSSENAIILIGLLVRLLVSPFFGDSYDSWVWHVIASAWVRRGINPYDYNLHHARLYADPYSYPVPWALLCTVGYFFSGPLPDDGGITILVFQKIPVIIADILLGIMLGKMVFDATGSRKAKKIAMASYLLNPYAFMGSALYFQFDAIPALFTVLALYFFKKDEVELAAVSLGMGIAFKMYPIILLPVFLAFLKERRLRFSLLSVLPIASCTLPFIVLNFPRFSHALFYQGNWSGNSTYWRSIWMRLGFDYYPRGETSPLLAQVTLVNTVITVSSLLLLYLYLLKRVDRMSLERGILLTFLVFFVTYRFIQDNHAMWAIPFAILDGIINRNRFERLWHIPLLFYTGTRWFYYLLSIPSWLGGFYYLELIWKIRDLTMVLVFPAFTLAYLLNSLTTAGAPSTPRPMVNSKSLKRAVSVSSLPQVFSPFWGCQISQNTSLHPPFPTQTPPSTLVT
jgi:hypothetical protein